jgi:hypothetical protein
MRRLAFGLALALAASAASAGATLSGRPAQAVRCAAYVGMAAQYGYDAGFITARDREEMTFWSVLVLERWVRLDPRGQMAAYRAILGEMGGRRETYALISRHADWCLAAFTPDR